MVTTLAGLMGEAEFWQQTTKTIRNIFIAIILATILGFLIGLLLFRLPRLRRAMEPVIASYYALPFFVLYPLAIVVVGMNDFSIILMGFAYALVAMITNTLSGLDRIPPVLAKTGRSSGWEGSRRQCGSSCRRRRRIFSPVSSWFSVTAWPG